MRNAMKKLLFILLCSIALTSCDKAPECDGNKGELARTLTKWMQDAVSDKYEVIVTDVHTFYELNSSPLLLGTTLYDDYKNSRLCSATANITIKDKEGKTFNGETEVRYQYTISLPDENDNSFSGVRMSDADVKEMTEKLRNTIYKEFKK